MIAKVPMRAHIILFIVNSIKIISVKIKLNCSNSKYHIKKNNNKKIIS